MVYVYEATKEQGPSAIAALRFTKERFRISPPYRSLRHFAYTKATTPLSKAGEEAGEGRPNKHDSK